MAAEGMEMLYEGDYERAEARLREALAAGDESAVPYLAEALWTLDRHGDFARLVDQYPQTKDLPDIQLRLGLMYLRGHDGTEDLAEALRWFYKAADQGHEEAKTTLERLGPN